MAVPSPINVTVVYTTVPFTGLGRATLSMCECGSGEVMCVGGVVGEA